MKGRSGRIMKIGNESGKIMKNRKKGISTKIMKTIYEREKRENYEN